MAELNSRSCRPKVSYIDDQIQAVVRNDNFSSCRQIASMFQSRGATVFRGLTEMGYISYFLRWIFYKLNDSNKKLRVSIAKIIPPKT